MQNDWQIPIVHKQKLARSKLQGSYTTYVRIEWDRGRPMPNTICLIPFDPINCAQHEGLQDQLT